MKKGENKKKRRGAKGNQAQVVKGISPQFPAKRANVDIMSKIIEEEKNFGQHSREVQKLHSPELKQIYDKPFPFI